MLHLSRLTKITFALAMPTSIMLLYWLYKRRYSDEESYEDKKIVTSRTVVIDVSVPPKAVGAIIGRQGATIKQIQKETGARLHFKEKTQNGDNSSNNLSPRTLSIQGSPECAQQAELMVYQIITSIPEVLTEQIQVPSYSIGAIIGKGGTSIREISHISGAKVFIERIEDTKTTSNLRAVELTGSRQQIDKALEIIEEKLNVLEEKRSKDRNSKNHVSHHHLKSVQVNSDDTLWDKPQESFPQDLDQTGLVNIYVSAVEHPGHFWVQVVGFKALQLEQIHRDITDFVTTDEAKLNYCVTQIIPGDLVAAQFEEDDLTYYRAKVLGETADGQVDLYFIDFGDNTYAFKENIFKLRSDFIQFPAQAIECKLATVQPVGGQWSEEAITCFENLTHCAQWKVLSAEMVKYDVDSKGRQRPLLKLIDKSQGHDVDIANELIRLGFAVRELNSINTSTSESKLIDEQGIVTEMKPHDSKILAVSTTEQSS
ncbi:tudor and KH domain-containing protein [Biomphalaria glabrata]|uniref:Tudor and KH domain-containing protein n=1 Tax=Biomphalaria glabrata TaxID=6526 RepID=A0A2C9LX40_BIOGL|nr:tudor and KH domain-containing protein [Biomphalaria glabrata]XP_013071002.1 tudor and KH domain-containing protein [Biomphalaria glabrata]KAI8752247.1 tudor and KH domain-containing protein-like [Biomphalaria glabrata]KAI8785978.1 tudor and KH domain-containing protein [Biomphalaria glabrata]